ncbi:hypothetical protein ADL12_23460 [Streptomyces regalis]|uniref:Uncharacterized protein n=1 Tax=Streptomyces regalis TaxID=68262 RepID=A0A124GAG4_9ACTN|nr:hypothetical protein ADL12_23460 [Streptomyces regalis]
MIEPSSSMESQRSHTVVAPIVTGYSHEGHSVWVKWREAAVAWPVAVRASQMIGVPTKPVAMR